MSRFELKVGKFGHYYYDSVNKKDLSLDDVLRYINRDSIILNLQKRDEQSKKRIQELEKQLAESIPKKDYDNMRVVALYLMGESKSLKITSYGVSEIFKKLDGYEMSISTGNKKLVFKLLKKGD
jgi:hypothetical protein